MPTQRFAPASMRALFISVITLALSACGGGGSSDPQQAVTPPPVSTDPGCVTADTAPASDQCGVVWLTVTDADGDFTRYQVEVVSVTLESSSGALVEALPAQTSIDFADYVDLTELAAAAAVPVGTYVRGEITLDYRDADIQVEVAGESVAAAVVDAQGNAVETITLALELDHRNRLVITHRNPAMLALDFDLAASHVVATDVSPAQAELLPVLTAEIDPLEQKEMRLRGALLEVDATEDSYRIALRPFSRREGRFGGVDIYTDAETVWEIHGEAFTGAAGLSALEELDAGTATLAFGVFDRENRQFLAERVAIGESVPGGTLDAVRGYVVARDGDLVMLSGARVLRTDGSVSFHDGLLLELDPLTSVRRARAPADPISIDAISVGQKIDALGVWDAERALMDLGEGAVRLRVSTVAATLAGHSDEQMQVKALAFGGRDISLFSFAGTGAAADTDADPENYEVDAGGLNAGLEVGDALQLRGFVTPFGSAPADFEALSVVNYSDVDARLLVNWSETSTAAALTAFDASGLSLNLDSDALGPLHYLRLGAVRTDLLALDAIPLLVPATDRGIYVISESGNLVAFSDFTEFVTELSMRLEQGSLIAMMHGRGQLVEDNTRLVLRRLAVVLGR